MNRYQHSTFKIKFNNQSILNMKKVFFLFCALFIGHAAYSQYGSEYNYELNWELDSKTGKYRPAYTYSASAGNSTIWLDSGAEKKIKSSPAKSEKHRFVEVAVPKKWKVEKSAERMKTSAADGTEFTVYKSYESRLSQDAEFKSNWNRFYPNRKMPEVKAQTFDNLGKVLLGIDVIGNKVEELSVNALVVILSEGVFYPLTIHFPSYESYEKHSGEMTKFLESFKTNQAETSKEIR